MHFRSGPVSRSVQGPVQAAPTESGQHTAAADRQGQTPADLIPSRLKESQKKMIHSLLRKPKNSR